MTHVRLMGELGEKFGSDWNCVDNSIRDILKLIDCQTEGFKDYLAECHMKNVQFSIETGNNLIEEFPELYMNVAKDTVIITPVPAGSGKGLGKLITGLLLLAAMFFMPGFGAALTTGGTTTASGAFVATTGSGMAVTTTVGTSMQAAIASGATLNLSGMAVMMLGTNLALMGLAEMSAPDPDKTTDDPSYLFNGAENHIEQGQPVPLLYGELTIGGSPIYQGYTPGVRSNYSRGYTYTGTAGNPAGTYANYGNQRNGGISYNPSLGWIGTGNSVYRWAYNLNSAIWDESIEIPAPDDTVGA